MSIPSRFLALALTLFTPAIAVAASPYAGQETRAIKSLSADDIATLRKGGGWGFAKAAELNGLPGPAHVLELADDLKLTARQTAAIQKLFDGMNAAARATGAKLLQAEAALEAYFRTEPKDETELARLVEATGKLRAELRLIHLRTHLKTPAILTPKQVAAYNRLRGYTDGSQHRGSAAGEKRGSSH